ncbi:hypothetical protein Anas_09449, partial [Armadillidium nasatum]
MALDKRFIEVIKKLLDKAKAINFVVFHLTLVLQECRQLIERRLDPFFDIGNIGRSNNDYQSILSDLVKKGGNKGRDSTPDVSDILGNIVQRKKGGGGGGEVSDMSDFISSLLRKLKNGGQSNDISIFLKDLKLPYGVNVPQGLD